MKRRLFAVVALVVAGALLLPSAAAPSENVDRIGNVTLEPHSGPNGDYAVLEDDGAGGQELALRFGPSNPNLTADGVATNTVTPVDNVFNITHVGDGDVEVWVESDVSELEFYRSDDPSAAVDSAGDAVVLGPEETLQVGVRIDTTGDVRSISAKNFTVHAESVTTATTTD